MKINKFLILFILIFISICLISSISYADSLYENGLAYRQVNNKGYDSLTDSYVFDFRIYNSGGMYQGSVNVPSSIYNLNNWIMVVTPGRLS